MFYKKSAVVASLYERVTGGVMILKLNEPEISTVPLYLLLLHK